MRWPTAVTVNGTEAADLIAAATAPGGVAVTGLAAAVTVVDADAGQDVLTLAGLAGDDEIDATGVSAGAIQTAIDGGSGIDLIRGTRGDDVITGGDGDDVVTGGDGNDTVFLGGGDDVFGWFAGDDNDTVEGEAGTDGTQVNGSSGAESFDVSAVGDHVRVTRDIGAVSLMLGAVEHLGLAVGGGADNANGRRPHRHRPGRRRDRR